jgi:hypothetical protein
VAVITSADSVVSVTVTVTQADADGVYEIQISAVTPAGQAIAIEYGGNRVWQGPARVDAGGG